MRGRGALVVEARLGLWRRIRVGGLVEGGLVVIRLFVSGLRVGVILLLESSVVVWVGVEGLFGDD